MGLKNIFRKDFKNSHKRYEHFDLNRYFLISSIGVFIFITVILGLVFIRYQKNLLIDYAVSTTEKFAHQLIHHIYDEGIISTFNDKKGIILHRDSPDFIRLDKMIKSYLRDFSDVIKIKIYNKQGLIVYSTDPENIGVFNDHDILKMALNGEIVSKLIRRMEPLLEERTERGRLYEDDLLEIYIPIYEYNSDKASLGDVVGAFEIYKNVTMVFNKSRKGGVALFVLFTASMTILFLILQLIVRKADNIIKKKNAEIDRYNKELEEAQHKIFESIDEVIKHESFHVRYVNDNLVKCWEVKKCAKTDCPSYQSENLRCWQVAGTFCGGEVQGVFAKKYGDCRECEVFKHALSDRINMIGESFNNMMALLQNKHLELQEANKKLNILVDIDPLTQISNRRSFQKRIEHIHLMSLRYNHPYSIIICDIDNFKLYNDAYGHQQGDYVLISVANVMKSSLRRTDEIFRWGGEEFIVILPEQGHSDALKVAEHLRATVQGLGIEHRKSDIGIVTISCGVASFYPWKSRDIGWEYVIKQADDALYKAKLGKKNCVYSAAIP